MYMSITDRKIAVGLLGCGRIAQSHLKAIDAHRDELQLAAVCDILPERLLPITKDFGIPGYRRLSEMLESIKLDLVAVCTPSGLHSEQTMEIARYGVHIMTEKPMATRWEDGVRMVKACDDAGVRLFVVKQNRRNATLQLLKKAIDENRFGRLYSVAVNVFWTRPQEYYDSAKWRGTWEFDGGAFMNQASHYIDLLDWLVGPVESVMAYTGTLARNIEVEDSGVAALRWRNGAMGTVNVTMLTYPKNLEGSITILGESGSVRIGGVAVNEIQHWEFAQSRPEDEKIKEASYQTSSVYGFGHPLYYENVIQTLRGITEPDTCGREGLRSLELLIAMYLSARDGRKIALPLRY
jgi:UDP-N-acetyl-2-amino-2-deoxyglucuronate dehydrogenase